MYAAQLRDAQEPAPEKGRRSLGVQQLFRETGTFRGHDDFRRQPHFSVCNEELFLGRLQVAFESPQGFPPRQQMPLGVHALHTD